MNHALIGGIALTHLKVYQQRSGPDGVNSGCCHVHGLSDEAYYCVAGEGAVEFHDLERGFVRHPMKPGSFLQFPPGTLHRSVSYRQCEFLVIMGNGGLPEHGDARIYFGPEVDACPEEYERLKALTSQGIEGALRRRDASTIAYTRLLEYWFNDRAAYAAELERFCALHRHQISDNGAEFESLIKAGAGSQLENSLDRVHRLPEHSPADPIRYTETTSLPEVFGMCGLLHQIDPISDLSSRIRKRNGVDSRL
ncbi:MAG: cupin domain-containing protein [Gammaproteobacteria bacterium]|nr:cupin domain-containing protein [Gammaproteobacteria bacterium]